ncbi:MAG: NAD(P)-binding domain-containing protein [Actinomycetota bacterium]|nr:NAD(P)-binding domain-containing protein [Actinomycetota bacterium]
MDTRVAIIGAGPYGLATAAHLRRLGVVPLVLGRVMGAWERMPPGMLLRSFRESTSIGDPDGRLTMDQFERERGRPVAAPVPIVDFVEYGRWFQARAVPETDGRLVRSLEDDSDGFRLVLDDGVEVSAGNVVVAAGIEPFSRLPPELQGVDHGLVSHSSSHSDFTGLRGRRLLVLGAGQSALEWGVLAHEAGAEVEIVCRCRPRFLRGERVHERAGVFRPFVYPRWGVGPPGINWIMGRPELFRRLPMQTARTLAQRAIRPAGAAWLRPRLSSIRVTTDTAIRSARGMASELCVALDDGTERRVDHLIAATGYRIDISRYPFLVPSIVARLERVDGFPRLTNAYESSVQGLYFVGAPAAASMGPGMRFVSHSGIAAAAVARHLTRSR